MKALLGKPVLLGGKAVGHVAEVELDEALTRMTALYVDGGLSGTRRIAGEQVHLLGEVSVLVTDTGRRGRPKEAKMRRARLHDGRRIGAVTGALLDEETFEVRALELTRGYLDDMFSGRQWFFHYAVNPVNGEVLIESEGGYAK